MLASFWSGLGSIVMVVVSLLLIALILLQKNRGSGLSGAFGGVGGNTAFGTKTGDFLTWVTVGLAVTFLLLAILLNFAFEPTSIADTAGAGAPVGTANTPAAGAGDTGSAAPQTTGQRPAPASGSPSPPNGG